jgi:thiamine biosynthesis lipoprotein
VTTAARAFRALGTTASVVVTDPSRLASAAALLREEVDAIDLACSRFRADSEISRLHEQAGRQVRVGELLAEALGAALRAARLTGGLVDPTVGAAVRALGYDRDFALVAGVVSEKQCSNPVSHSRPAAADRSTAADPAPAPGWHRVLFDPALRLVVLPRGVHLDLGATAKALAADRAASRIHAALGCGVLVNLGGDLRVAGPEPAGGWQVALGDDHADAVTRPAALVALNAGGLATSGTANRRWRHAGRTVHHIVDPRTGDVAEPRWRTVSVAAKSTVDANTASTAAIVLGTGAPRWLEDRRLPARLTSDAGEVVTTAGWPAERRAA